MLMKWGSLFIVVVTLGLAMWVVTDRATYLRTRATVGGLVLTLRHTKWVEDQMDHGGEGFEMPESMMVDYPERGMHRLQVSISLHNASSRTRTFDPSALRVTVQPRRGVEAGLRRNRPSPTGRATTGPRLRALRRPGEC